MSLWNIWHKVEKDIGWTKKYNLVSTNWKYINWWKK